MIRELTNKLASDMRYESRFRCYVHFGHGKCGSSSIQQFLCDNKVLTANDGSHATYVCLTNKGKVVYDIALNELSSCRPTTASDIPAQPEPEILGRVDDDLFKLIDLTNLIISGEDFYDKFSLFENSRFFLEMARSGRLHFIYAFRSPISFANSSWWQWGYWRKRCTRPTYRNWLSNLGIGASHWDKIKKFQSYSSSNIAFLLVEEGDIVEQFIGVTNLDESCMDLNIRKSNNTLPACALKLLKDTGVRTPHHSNIDFILPKALSLSLLDYPKPFCLSDDDIKLVYELYTNPLLTYLGEYHPDIHSRVSSIPAYSDISYFQGRQNCTPLLHEYTPDHIYKMLQDIIQSLEDKILAGNIDYQQQGFT